MPKLHIQGEYPDDWDEIGDRVREEAGHRCIRCGHPFRTGAHGKGEWTPCDEKCRHHGPLAFIDAHGAVAIIANDDMPSRNAQAIAQGKPIGRVVAQWRILTVHHLDGNKSNCVWWNLLALCQRCHLEIQGRVNPDQPWMLEHSDWFKPYVAGFYAKKYEGRDVTRDEAMARLDELLAYERIA